MRIATFVLATILLATILSLAPWTAGAQTTPPPIGTPGSAPTGTMPPTRPQQPSTTGQGLREAPIGHRQPRASDVPSGERLEPLPGERALDRQLQICRRC